MKEDRNRPRDAHGKHAARSQGSTSRSCHHERSPRAKHPQEVLTHFWRQLSGRALVECERTKSYAKTPGMCGGDFVSLTKKWSQAVLFISRFTKTCYPSQIIGKILANPIAYSVSFAAIRHSYSVASFLLV